MIELIKETRKGNIDVFMAVSLELLKSRDEMFKMKKGLGLK